MRLRNLFEKEVFVRLSEDHTAFICTTRWPWLSKTRRNTIDETGRYAASQVRELSSITPEERLVLRRSAVEQDPAHQTAEFERALGEK
jgi:hypothetical protein